jgi:hypothetical protein
MEATSGVTALPKNADARLLKGPNQFYFGKYKGTGKTVGELIKEDPGYILYVHEKVAFVRFEDSTIQQALKNKTKVNFDLNPQLLESSTEVINAIHNGLDTVASEDGVRQLHGLTSSQDPHRALRYFKSLAQFIKQELQPGGLLESLNNTTDAKG